VVIPAYQRAATIVAAIDSVLRQTWSDFELIVVDDGSTDGTAAAAATVADPRLRLVRLPANRGAAAARNAGAAQARGRWIAFQDSDDEWLPEKLARQLARLETRPGAVAAYCGLLTVGALEADGSGRTRILYTPPPETRVVEGRIQPTLLRQNVMSTQTVVVRRDVFLSLGGFDESLPAMEDWEFAIRLAGAGEIAFVDAPLVHQRFSANSLTRNLEKQRRAHALILEKSLPLYAGHPDLLAWQHYVLAGLSRRAGDLAAARRQLARARAVRPAAPRTLARALAMSLYVAALGPTARLRGGSGKIIED
jgi:glycosyltransferase involved in cell wall biosynthesis